MLTAYSASGTSSHPSKCARKLLITMALFQQIAEPAQRDDRSVAWLELFPQAVNVHLDRIRSDRLVNTEQTVREHLLADCLADLHHQRFKNSMFAGREPQDRIVQGKDPADGIVAERPALESRVLVPVSYTHLRAHETRHE